MNYRIFILFSLIGSSTAFAVNQSTQNIEIKNNSAHNLNLNLTVPEYTKAVIAMTSLKTKVDAQSMLHTAILNDSAEGIKEAVQAGADVGQPRTGKSPILTAVLLKRSNAVEALMECGASILADHNNEVDETLIQYSIKLGDFKSALCMLKKMFLDKGPQWQPHREGCFISLLRESIKQRDIQSAIWILRDSTYFMGKKQLTLNDLNENMQYNTNHIKMRDIFYLLREKDATGYEPASLESILELIQELISHGYSVNNIWHDKEIQRWLYAKEEILELFVKNGANPHYRIGIQPNCTYPIFKAIEAGNVKAVKILLENGAFVNEVVDSVNSAQGYSCRNKTPLGYAIILGKSDMVALLLEYGANL